MFQNKISDENEYPYVTKYARRVVHK